MRRDFWDNAGITGSAWKPPGTDQEVYLWAYPSVSEARASVRRYFGFYDGKRLHFSLGGQTPEQIYFNQPTPIPAAA